MFSPSAAQSASCTLSSTSRGVPPLMGIRASVPVSIHPPRSTVLSRTASSPLFEIDNSSASFTPSSRKPGSSVRPTYSWLSPPSQEALYTTLPSGVKRAFPTEPARNVIGWYSGKDTRSLPRPNHQPTPSIKAASTSAPASSRSWMRGATSSLRPPALPASAVPDFSPDNAAPSVPMPEEHCAPFPIVQRVPLSKSRSSFPPEILRETHAARKPFHTGSPQTQKRPSDGPLACPAPAPATYTQPSPSPGPVRCSPASSPHPRPYRFPGASASPARSQESSPDRRG